jgi:hypothetical protein
VALAISLQVPYDVVARWDDRIKSTHWAILEELHDRRA